VPASSTPTSLPTLCWLSSTGSRYASTRPGGRPRLSTARDRPHHWSAGGVDLRWTGGCGEANVTGAPLLWRAGKAQRQSSNSVRCRRGFDSLKLGERRSCSSRNQPGQPPKAQYPHGQRPAFTGCATALPNVSKVPVGAGRGKQPPSVRRFRECPHSTICDIRVRRLS
jgi:hypothetical protein